MADFRVTPPHHRLGILVQVRLASTRLPGKALVPLPGGNIIQHVMRALRHVPAAVYALVTDAASAPRLRTLAVADGFEIFTGHPTDVLERYQKAADFFKLDTIVRATGDNPLVSPKLANSIIDIHLTKQADLSHYLDIPLGTGIEVISKRALAVMAQKATDPFEHEHMTTYIYRHRESFKVVEEPGPKEYYFPKIRVSVDTPVDYERMSRIYEALYQSRPIEIDKLAAWLRENDGKENTDSSSPAKRDGNRTSGQEPVSMKPARQRSISGSTRW